MAITAGVNQAAILRLKYTIGNAPKNILKNLQMLEQKLSAIGSYRDYRVTLKSVDPPTIPYIGVYLGDLIFIEEGNPDELEGLINFNKCRLTYKVIAEIQQYQHLGYDSLSIDASLISYLKQLTFTGEKELFELSLLREPRGAAKEDII